MRCGGPGHSSYKTCAVTYSGSPSLSRFLCTPMLYHPLDRASSVTPSQGPLAAALAPQMILSSMDWLITNRTVVRDPVPYLNAIKG